MTAWSAFATAALVLIGLGIALWSGTTWMQIQRQQAEDLGRLRHELRRQQSAAVADADAGALPRIGASTRVFQVGDSVEVIEGVHRGDHGTIAPAPEWLKPGYVCVDLVRDGSQAYMPSSRLVPLDDGRTS